jgi:hypothetical protein
MKLLALIFIPVCSFGQIKLEQKIFLANNKVEIMVPNTLTNMSEEMWALKYQKRARPVLVLTDTDAEVNLVADLTAQPAAESQMASFKDFQMAQLKKSRPELLFLGDGVKTVNGKKLGYFKFLSQAIDQKVFNYYFFTVVDGKILLFSFNCIEKLKSTWEKTAEEMVASLKVK